MHPKMPNVITTFERDPSQDAQRARELAAQTGNQIPEYAQLGIEPMFISNHQGYLVPNPNYTQTENPLPIAQQDLSVTNRADSQYKLPEWATDYDADKQTPFEAMGYSRR